MGGNAPPDPFCLSVETYYVAHENGFVKYNFTHRDCDKALDACVPVRFDCARYVYVTQYDAAENCPLRIRIARHHRHANRSVTRDSLARRSFAR